MRAHENVFDFGTLHLLTASTEQLAPPRARDRFDPRRFRPNIVLDAHDAGFIETLWQGHTLTIGHVRLIVGIPVPRCVMTTLAQGDLAADWNVLRTISRYNGVDILGTGTAYPCVGVYADASAGGQVGVGDTVTID